MANESGDDFKKTMIVGVLLLVAMAVLTSVMCLCIGKDLKKRLNNQFPPLTNEQKEYVNKQKIDYQAVNGPSSSEANDGVDVVQHSGVDVVKDYNASDANIPLDNNSHNQQKSPSVSH